MTVPRARLLVEVVVMAFDTVRTNKMRSGPDRARRGHRHHVDRRHDGAHPRVRPVAARSDRAERTEHHLPSSGSASPASPTAPSSAKLLKRPEPRRSPTRARSRRRADTIAASSTSQLGAGPGPVTQRRVFYRDQKTKQPDRVRAPARSSPTGTQLPMLARTVLQRHRQFSTARNVVRAGQHRLQAAVRGERHRSARQVRARRQRALRGASACSTSGRRRAASTSARTTSSSCPHTTYHAAFGLRGIAGRGGRGGRSPTS